MKVVAVLTILALFTVAESVRKCYICDDNTTTKCNDLQDSHKKDCSVADDGNCYKYGESDKRNHGCTKEDEKTFCTDTKKDCSVCSEDYCNSSSSVMASAALIAVSAILLKMYN